MNQVKFKFLSFFLTALVASCGGGGGGGSSAKPTSVSYVVDAPVEGLSYSCGALTGITGSDGSFLHDVGAACTFKIGNIIVGEFNSAPTDGVVTPHDLASVSRADSLNSSAVAIAQFLQSLDDGTGTGGIKIPTSAAIALSNSPSQKIGDQTTTISQNSLSNLVATATNNAKTLVSAVTAGARMNAYIQTTYPTLDVSKGVVKNEANLSSATSDSGSMPIFTAPPPSSLTAVKNSVGLTATANITSVGYYVVLPSTAATPSKWQVLAGLDAANNIVRLSGSFNLPAETSVTKTIQDLPYNKDYKVYFVAANSTDARKMSDMVISNVSIAAAVAPVISSSFPSTLTPNNKSISFSVTSDVSGTGYWILTAQSATAPTAAQVIAGNDGSWSVPPLKGSAAFSAGVSKDIVISNLKYGELYRLYFVGVNAFDTSKITSVLTSDVSAEYPTGVTGVKGNITSNTTWSSGKYMLSGDVGVANGVTLTINSGVTVYHDSGSLIVAGALVTNGTSLSRVQFTTLPSSSIGQAAQKSGNIKFSNSVNSSINYTTIENVSGVSIQLDGDSVVPIRNTIFRNNYTVISDTYGYQYMDIRNCTFTDNTNVFSGIRTSNADILNNHFENNTNIFEYGYFGGTVNITGNNFINSTLVFKADEGQSTINMINNWWNTTDTGVIGRMIYDTNDLVTLKTVNYLPISTTTNNAGSN